MHIKPTIMTSNEILKADVLDILFDNRNKQYGAYALRKNYNNRLSLALGISLSTMLLFFLLMRIERPSRIITDDSNKTEVVVDHVIPPDIKKPDPIIPKKRNPAPQVRTEKLTTIKIEKDDLVKTTIPDQNALLTSVISNVKLNGDIANNIPIVKEPAPENPLKQETKSSEFAPIQREPEFPGGQQAWMNFLQKNLISPDELEAGDKKMVSIRFQVSAEGIVTNFEIVQSAGRSFDNEVIRVLKKMPRWKPAIQNGLPVARAFTQPVTFVGVEQ
jgi:protein TonB